MTDATIACARLRGLDAPSRVQPVHTGGAGAPGLRASCRRAGADGAAIDPGTSTRPGTPSPRPATDALATSVIRAPAIEHPRAHVRPLADRGTYRERLWTAVAMPTMHLAWGVGFLRGVLSGAGDTVDASRLGTRNTPLP